MVRSYFLTPPPKEYDFINLYVSYNICIRSIVNLYVNNKNVSVDKLVDLFLV